MKKLYYTITDFFISCVVFSLRFVLRKHRFKPSDLIYKSGTRVIYEVDMNFYDSKLNPVTIVRRFGGKTHLYSIDHHSILEYVEYRELPNTPLYSRFGTESIVITDHENTKFGTEHKALKKLKGE